MSTEEIIQRTRLLDSEIKVGAGGAPSGQQAWHLQLPPKIPKRDRVAACSFLEAGKLGHRFLPVLDVVRA